MGYSSLLHKHLVPQLILDGQAIHLSQQVKPLNANTCLARRDGKDDSGKGVSCSVVCRTAAAMIRLALVQCSGQSRCSVVF